MTLSDFSLLVKSDHLLFVANVTILSIFNREQEKRRHSLIVHTNMKQHTILHRTMFGENRSRREQTNVLKAHILTSAHPVSSLRPDRNYGSRVIISSTPPPNKLPFPLTFFSPPVKLLISGPSRGGDKSLRRDERSSAGERQTPSAASLLFHMLLVSRTATEKPSSTPLWNAFPSPIRQLCMNGSARQKRKERKRQVGTFTFFVEQIGRAHV